MKYIVDKCHKFGVKKYIKMIYATRVSLEVLDEIHDERSIFVLVMVLYIWMIETLEWCTFMKTFSISYYQVKIFNNIISCLNCNFVMYPLPWTIWTEVRP